MFVISPPAIYATGPLPADLRYVREPERKANRDCSRALGSFPQGGAYYACYDPRTHTIYLPSDVPDYIGRELRAHEEAHARGWRHDAADLAREGVR